MNYNTNYLKYFDRLYMNFFLPSRKHINNSSAVCIRVQKTKCNLTLIFIEQFLSLQIFFQWDLFFILKKSLLNSHKKKIEKFLFWFFHFPFHIKVFLKQTLTESTLFLVYPGKKLNYRNLFQKKENTISIKKIKIYGFSVEPIKQRK